MNMRKNEQGYALLLVLFLVVFIVGISAVFMRGAISNAKQEQRVDKNHLSVVAAEMGVEYYTTLFTNEFLSARDDAWRDVLQASNEVEEPIDSDNFRGDVAAIIITALKDAYGAVNPSDSNFTNDDMFFKVDEHKNIIISGEIFGEYLDGKDSTLGLELAFEIPELEVEEDEAGEGGSNNGGGGSIAMPTIPELKWDGPNDIPEVNVTVSEEIGGQDTPTNPGSSGKVEIKKKGDLTTGQIQSNGNQVDISSTGNFKSSSNISNNKNVTIETNGLFESKLIQENKGHLTILANGNTKIDGNLYGNDNVKVITNGNFSSKSVENNKGRLEISVEGEFESSNLSGNKDVTIQTNGKLTTGDMKGNTGYFNINSSGNIVAKEITTSQNVSIQTKGNFTSGLIEQNKIGGIQIVTTGDFKSGNLQFNNDVFIQSKDSFESDNLYENNKAKFYSGDGMKVNGQVQNNVDTIIQTNGNFEASGNFNANKKLNLYSNGEVKLSNQFQGNENTIVYSNGNFSSSNFYGNKDTQLYSGGNITLTNQIQDNDRVTIVAVGNLKTSSIQIRNNSFVCVGGDLETGNYNTVDSTSKIYMRGSKRPIKNITNSNWIEFLMDNEWESQCGVGLATGPGEVKDEANWEPPIVNVEYN